MQQKFPDIDALAAQLIMKVRTNKLEEGSGEGDFGDLYPGYTWRGETNQIATNGLDQVVKRVRDFHAESKWTQGRRFNRPAIIRFLCKLHHRREDKP